MYLETCWTEAHNFSLIDAINTKTAPVAKYRERGDRTNPTPDWLSLAQVATYNWILETNPDSEDFRSAIATINKEGPYHGVTFLDILFLVNNGDSSPERKLLLQAKETYASDISGSRHFGDSLVVDPRDSFENQTSTAIYMACSNGCPAPMSYLSRIRRDRLNSSSLPLQPVFLPELDYCFEKLDADTRVHVWDNARANKTWLAIMGMIERSSNHSLYHDIMHRREELPDTAGEIQHLPAKVGDSRQVRLLALEDSYKIVKSIWRKFDDVYTSRPGQAEQQFNQDIIRLQGLIQQAPTLPELAKSFLPHPTT